MYENEREKMNEILIQLIALCTIAGPYQNVKMMEYAGHEKAACVKWYAKCMDKHYGKMEWDHIMKCIGERPVDSTAPGEPTGK